MVLELERQSVQQNACLELVAGPRAVHRVFEICQLTEVLWFIGGQRSVSTSAPITAIRFRRRSG